MTIYKVSNQKYDHSILLAISRFYLYKKAISCKIAFLWECGADRTRTGVQTNSPQAFYMFIYVLIVGKKPEHNKPTFFVEEWS
jgi:hypothetical protein